MKIVQLGFIFTVFLEFIYFEIEVVTNESWCKK
jgi:hypothetical protein